VVGNIPPGYPIPTTANVAGCQTVAVSTTECTGQNAGDVCIECLFGGSTYNTTTTPTPDATAEAGNYLVTVTLGGTTAGQTYISAESARGLLAPVLTSVGQMLEYAFVVNVRAMEGQPNFSAAPGGYPGLDLFFSGPAATPPQVLAIGYTLATTKPMTVFIASDSTACDETAAGVAGWGQILPEYFGPPIGIANYANSGASSATFYASPSLWGGITSKWTPGDWVFIQFGANDKMISDAIVEANLMKYVADAQAAQVHAILISPPARAVWNGSVFSDQSSLHAAAAYSAALATGAAYVDLTALSTDWYNQLGPAGWQAYHAVLSGGTTDASLTNLAGAGKLAGLVATAIKNQNLGLAQYLRP
jgi:lysophospholipase L1-like esterase